MTTRAVLCYYIIMTNDSVYILVVKNASTGTVFRTAEGAKSYARHYYNFLETDWIEGESSLSTYWFLQKKDTGEVVATIRETHVHPY